MFSCLYGNERVKQDLTATLKTDRLAHAYLLEGPPQSGKHTLARALAMALAQKMGDGAFCDKIARGLCPDVVTLGLEDEKKTISVDLVRRLKESVFFAPVELSFQFYIIENTDCMTAQAQNALLKLLEEPPRAVYFLLLCESATALLPTVRSRAPALRMERFSVQDLETGLLLRETGARTLKEKDPQAFLRILQQSEGIYGVAKTLLTGKQSKKETLALEKTVQMLTLFSKRDTASVLSAISLLSQKREQMTEELLSLQQAVLEICLQKKGVQRKNAFPESLCQSLSFGVWMTLQQAVQSCLQAVQSNANLALQQMCLAYGVIHAVQGTPPLLIKDTL